MPDQQLSYGEKLYSNEISNQKTCLGKRNSLKISNDVGERMFKKSPLRGRKHTRAKIACKMGENVIPPIIVIPPSPETENGPDNRGAPRFVVEKVGPAL